MHNSNAQKEHKKLTKKQIKNFTSSKEFKELLENPVVGLFVAASEKEIHKITTDKTNIKFKVLKQTINLLINEVSERTAKITERQLDCATAALIKFLNSIKTEDKAPAHKKVTGLKFYSSAFRRLNVITLFKNHNIVFFEKHEKSNYIANELARSLRSYDSGYTHTYIPTKHFIFLNRILNTIIKSEKIELIELYNIRKISDTVMKDLKKENESYFSISTERYFKLMNYFSSCIIKNAENKLQGTKKIFSNCIGIYKGKIIINNKTANSKTDIHNRNYTIYGLLSKELREFIHPDRVEIDMNTAVYSVLSNIKMLLDKAEEKKWFILNTNTGQKYIKKSNTVSDLRFEYPAINHLLENKHSSRRAISSALGISEKDAKVFITSLIFDPFKRNLLFNEKYNNALTNYSNRKEVIYTKNLLREVNEFSRSIHYKIFKSEKEYNIFGISSITIRNKIQKDILNDKIKNPKKYGKGRKLFGKELARFYFFLESKIRETIIKYSTLRLKDIDCEILQIHDCIVLPKEFNKTFSLKNLSEVIEKTCEFKIKFS